MANTKYMILLVLAIIFLYLISLSLSVGVDVDINTDENIGKITATLFFIPIFKKRLKVDKLLMRETDRPEQQTENNDETGENKTTSGFKKFLLDCAVKILKSVRIREFDLNSKIGTGDAAADGVAVGMLRIFYTQFCMFFGRDPKELKCVIQPDYDNQILYFLFFGIFSISFADIIFAVLCAVIEKLGRRGQRRVYANAAE